MGSMTPQITILDRLLSFPEVFPQLEIRKHLKLGNHKTITSYAGLYSKKKYLKHAKKEEKKKNLLPSGLQKHSVTNSSSKIEQKQYIMKSLKNGVVFEKVSAMELEHVNKL